MTKKIKPQTKEIREIVESHEELQEDSRILKRDLEEVADQQKANKKQLVVQQIDDTDTSALDVADDLSERVLKGDSQATHALANQVSQTAKDALDSFVFYQQVAVEEQAKLMEAKDPEQKRSLLMQQQMAANHEKRKSLQMLMRAFRQVQHTRVSIGNRIFAWGREHILGLNPSQSTEELSSKDAARIMREIKEDYKRVSDGMITRMIRHGLPEDSRLDPCSLVLVDMFILLEAEEDKLVRRIEAVMEDFEIYRKFFRPVPGVGPISAGGLTAILNIGAARYASSFVKYAGYDVVKRWDEKKQDWVFEGRSKRKEHLVKKRYIDRDGNEQEKLSITFNPELKRLMYNLATSFIKIRNRIDESKPLEEWPGYKIPNYGLIYEGYKHRKMIDNELNNKGLTKAHIDSMAKRAMIKVFLQELHPLWCYLLKAYEKIRLPWQVAYMDGQDYHPTFAPLREIVFTHAVRDREKIAKLYESEKNLRNAGFTKPF